MPGPESIDKCKFIDIIKSLMFVYVSAAGNGNLDCLQWLVEMGANSKLQFADSYPLLCLFWQASKGGVCEVEMK